MKLIWKQQAEMIKKQKNKILIDFLGRVDIRQKISNVENSLQKSFQMKNKKKV